ncbi:hypothetical protein DSCW_36160 [Desulfosarcina widdelii]|uniref:Chemotaxis methyl-accepting receptor HlyB-like 4HB MCP domain-containing protein n=1 Tax=Desulfosarcina widdelii TaxID=947919 RepID=A0A5K7Z7Q9_9BACT|nr:MCP four helix bundle domain-containing protein [Desulfosarcina widdelii]BBO76199.1 hypothetical protein DSCW_36160 [Desulfosarcina widdelii]
MNKSNRKISPDGIKMALCILVLAAFIMMMFGTVRSTSFDQMSGKKLLHQIRVDTLAYRLAELESLLSFEKTQWDEYKDRMTSEAVQLERNMAELKKILVTDEEKTAYACFKEDWTAYTININAIPELAVKGSVPQVAEAFVQTSRALYEKSRQSLDTLFEVKANAPESWSGFFKIFTTGNKLTLSFLFICGTAAIFILIFNLYDKAMRRINS